MLDGLIAYTTIHEARFQVSIHRDPRAREERPYHVMLFSRDSEYLGRGGDSTYFRSVSDAKRSCYRRFGISKRAWQDAYEISPARAVLEKFSRARELAVMRPEVWPLSMTQTREFVVAATQTEFANRPVLIEAADTVLCATMKADTGLTFQALHVDRVSRYSEEFPLKWEGFNLLEIERFCPHEDSSYYLWVEEAFEEEFHEWLPGSDCVSILDASNLTPAEDLLVRFGEIVFVFDAGRPIEDALESLGKIANRLPGLKLPPGAFRVRGQTMDPLQLPEPLRRLVPWTKRWAIADDERRLHKLASASRAERQRLRQTIEPLLPDINDYLASFGESPLPDEAILIMHLASTVPALRKRRRKRKKAEE